MLSCWPAGS
jgi:hypothetical protein